MGSKTPDDYRRGPDDSSSRAAIAAINPSKPAAASGLFCGVLDGEDEDGEDDDDDRARANLNSTGQSEHGNKKKRKNNRKRKKKVLSGKQTAPPRVALANLFHDQQYPKGEIVEYSTKNDNLQRTTAEELRYLSVLNNIDDEFLSDYRRAAEVHRQVCQYAQTIAKPGISMSELAQEIEDGVRALTGCSGLETGDALKAGMGFPTGLCLNNVAAHWTPNPGAKEVILKYDDVLKVDFGVHVNGRIVDSAFTVAFNPAYDNLLAYVKAATNTGLEEAGIDACIDYISGAI
ncbi:MAG: hypothetical protein M1820_007831 [Bogoriella megaspora]|nr:MAG: hypothetical protein M1820_007831 [Bogoriella megaspora]